LSLLGSGRVNVKCLAAEAHAGEGVPPTPLGICTATVNLQSLLQEVARSTRTLQNRFPTAAQ